eukprot:2792912-Amphidinium_carterae.1
MVKENARQVWMVLLESTWTEREVWVRANEIGKCKKGNWGKASFPCSSRARKTCSKGERQEEKGEEQSKANLANFPSKIHILAKKVIRMQCSSRCEADNGELRLTISGCCPRPSDNDH